jgi:DNA-directed RNA polymerase subunit N
MMVNIRCWSCGKPIAHLWEEYKDRTLAGEDKKKVMDDLGLERYCCRSSLMSHIELVETAGKFKKF